MEPIRILHVLGGLNRGGAETMVVNLYRAIDKTKVQFDFIVHNEKENAYNKEILSMGGKIYVFPRFSLSRVLSYKKYWRVFLSNHPEYKILHSHVRSYATIFFSIARKKGLKTIVHSHSTSNGKGIKAFVKKILQLPLRKKTDYLFACSRISGEWLFGKEAVNYKNYRMIKNAIDTEKYIVDKEVREQYRQELNIGESVVYGHVGRLSEPKNHKFLLEIFAEIATNQQNAMLLLVGDGEYRTRIRRQIEDMNLSERVIMTGARSDVPQLLSAMDVFLFPSLWEGLPVTVVEAQAAGLPCFVSDKVTEEVKISEAVQYLSIDNGTSCWIQAAMQATNKRYDVINKIKAAGFDVNTSAKELTDFYMGLI